MPEFAATEHQETPAATNDESAELRSNFNAAMKEQEAAFDPAKASEEKTAEAEQETETKEKPASDASVKTTIPAQFLKKPEPVAESQEQPLVDEATRGVLKGKARESFDKLETSAKARIDAARAEAAAFKADLEKARTATGNTAEHDAMLKAERDARQALEQKLERVAYQESPKFQQFNSEEKAEITSAKSYLEGSEISPMILDAAASSTGAARLRLLREAGLDAWTIAAVQPHLARVDALRRERDSSLENWRTGLQQDQERQRQEQTALDQQHRAEEDRVFNEVGAKLRKELPAFQKVDGADDWNKLVETNERDVAEFFKGTKKLPELVELAFYGVSARTTDIMNKELTRMLNEATDELTRLKAAQPVTGKSVTVTQTVDANKTDPRSTSEQNRNAFNSAMAQVKGGG